MLPAAARAHHWGSPKTMALPDLVKHFTKSQSGVHRLAFQGENGEHTLVDLAQRPAAGEPLQGFGPEGELPHGQPPLGGDAPAAEPVEVLRERVLRAVDD